MIQSCWAHNSLERPSFLQLAHKLEEESASEACWIDQHATVVELPGYHAVGEDTMVESQGEDDNTMSDLREQIKSLQAQLLLARRRVE